MRLPFVENGGVVIEDEEEEKEYVLDEPRFKLVCRRWRLRLHGISLILSVKTMMQKPAMCFCRCDLWGTCLWLKFKQLVFI